MKHERGLQRQTWWRLKKTLSRKTDFRPIEREDLKYIGAAYRKGALASMGEDFASGEMSKDDFLDRFEREIRENYAAAWTLFAETGKGFIPVGLVLGFWSHPNPRFSPFMIVGDMIWFPWSSPRNRIESAVCFFHRIRHEIAMVEYAEERFKRFFEMICQHGVMRRIGTSYNVYPGAATAVYETRAP